MKRGTFLRLAAILAVAVAIGLAIARLAPEAIQAIVRMHGGQ
jgi:hypothetical protein